ncbi:hypothetical protein [Massilia sp. Root335]|uniref:hypothetical protein n=1 Tax=Massilia sp. Root335 TaxID=1736517 RepID=UPI0007004013|nr:hypothetical protein [Massilia sp. Root335]KQV28619.1 hypothetical protein ASC93_28195 [Massilia sp. Root335]
MLIVRSEQLAAMRAARLRQHLLADVHQQFGEDCRILGPDAVDKAIALGMTRAGRHGFLRTAEVRRWVRLMFLLGSCFDEDPLLPWAATILAGARAASPAARMHDLYGAAGAFLRDTAGADGRRYQTALLRIRRTGFDELTRGDPVRTLYRLYPAYYRSLSQRTLDDTLVRSAARVQAHGLGQEGLSCWLLLTCMAGTHVDRDPLYAWIAPALQASAAPGDKARLLHRAVMDHMDRYALFRRPANAAADLRREA